MLTDPAVLRTLLLDNVEKVIALQAQAKLLAIEVQTEQAKAAEQEAWAHAEHQRAEAETAKAEAAAPKVAALDLIATASGSLCVTDAAKTLQMRPSALFSWMRENDWIFKRSGENIGYQPHLVAGNLEHKVVTVVVGGNAKAVTQVRVTPRGLAQLATVFGVVEEAEEPLMRMEQEPDTTSAEASEAFKALLGRYSRAELARMTGVTRQNVTRWNDVPAKYLRLIMAKTGLGMLQLRPDLFPHDQA
jgi:phage antirepressor YoqD-like protein